MPRDHLDRGFVVDAPGRGHHDRLRRVPAVPIVTDRFARQADDRLLGAEDRWRKGMALPQGVDELLVGDVGRIVLVHVDLFEHDVTFAVDLVLSEGGPLELSLIHI